MPSAHMPFCSQSTLAGWSLNPTNQRVPVKILLPLLPRMR
jgi:hypothetical protein